MENLALSRITLSMPITYKDRLFRKFSPDDVTINDERFFFFEIVNAQRIFFTRKKTKNTSKAVKIFYNKTSSFLLKIFRIQN